MRGINLLPGRRKLKRWRQLKGRWQDHQQKQVNQLNAPGVRVAFPGSLLFNQLLVPVELAQSFTVASLVLPDFSDVIYGYCSDPERNPILENALVVDADDIDQDNDVIAGIIAEKVKRGDFSRVVVLGESALGILSESIRHHCGDEIEITLLEPNWMSAVALHSIYRQAASVVFVSTMRVLDAAGTGCQCSLIAGRHMINEDVFSIVQRYLESVACDVKDQAGMSVVADEKLLPFVIVDNNAAALHKSLNDVDGEDWLDGTLDSKPVIGPWISIETRALILLRDRRTGIRRKANKLQDDPNAFFADSNYKILRFLGRLAIKKAA